MSTQKPPREAADAAPETPPDEDPGDSSGGRKGKGRPRTTLAVAFRPAGRAHRIVIDSRFAEMDAGDLVVVETDRGLAIARVLGPAREEEDPDLSRQVRKIVRPAREPDLITHAEGKAREPRLLERTKDIAAHSGVDLQVIDVDFQAIGNKLTVFFISERRVDFRILVKTLSQKLGLRIEMRQVGVRDEAKHLGGVAHCGRELCCSSWLREFCPVSIRMAKDQNLALSPNKISGLCGRLMCCLSYEHGAYAEARKGLPKAGKRVQTRLGPGRVLSLDVLGRSFLFLGDDGTRQTLSPDDLERDDEGRPIRPPPPGEAPPGGPRRGAPGGGRAPRKPAAKEDGGEPSREPRRRPRRPKGDDAKDAGGEPTKRSRSSRRRRGRGRKRSSGPRKETENDG